VLKEINNERVKHSRNTNTNRETCDENVTKLKKTHTHTHTM
jgi:hypothetical protein